MNSTALGILSFIIDIAKREPYQNLVFLSSPDPARTFDEDDLSLIEHVSKATGVPIVSQTYTSSIDVNFNSELLTIVDFPTNLYIENLSRIRELFPFTAKVRILLVLDHYAPNSGFLQSLFQLCWKKKLLNVIAVSRDFARTNDIYGYKPYPALQIEKRRYSSAAIFPDTLKDLKGTFLEVFADQVAPRNMMTLKPNGDIKLSGFTGHIVNAFARKHNAKLSFPLPYELGKSVYFPDLKQLLLNDTIDLLVSLSIFNRSSAHSYTVEQSFYCLMIPMEEEVPITEIYAIVLRPSLLFAQYFCCCLLSALLVTATHYIDQKCEFRMIDIFINVTAIQAILAQSFKFLKNSSATSRLSCILLSWLGIYCTTWYLVYLKTYLTQRPMQRKVESVADLHWASYKVLIFWRENNELLQTIRKVFDESVVQATQNFTEFVWAVEHLDPRYAYMVYTSKWIAFKEQQKLFSRPLFRMTNICAIRDTQFAFPMHPNSVFKDAFNRVLMQVTDAGLFRHWMDKSFHEMVAIGQLTFADWSAPRQNFRPLQAKDLAFIFKLISLYFIIAVLVLIGELTVHKTRRMLEKKKRIKAHNLQDQEGSIEQVN